MHGGSVMLSPQTVFKVEEEIIKSLGEKQNPLTFKLFGHGFLTYRSNIN